MELELQHKTVFITGSTSGIGFAMAEGFLKEGAHVFINGRTQNSVDNAIDKLKASVSNANVSGIAANFKDSNAIEIIQEAIPQIDILINNVGIFASKLFEETTDTDWHEMFQVNVMSSVQLSRFFLPKMIAQNWGRILFVSSECAQLVPADLIAYSTTKTALLSLSRGLAQTTKGTKVTVNSLLPGSTLTEGAVEFLKDQASKDGKTEAQVAENFFKTDRNSSLLQRFAQPKEIADMALFLSSPLSAATNGAAIKVDGGSVPGIL
ncbi:SDR family oxidoreductase [Lutimonas halocynthiae]|uniref:SDR family NAD(P)-dependent oxidoreductase n=1 Tax=Lutimonas halocynthiae TaxID=1446477 RepID=UPI0025B42D3E|nr:SDR family oxidoreductase [Lutimonas halocynthiae]MDN3641667.1 SDR family oxidoreductase [Lutimonas halocynthiae]